MLILSRALAGLQKRRSIVFAFRIASAGVAAYLLVYFLGRQEGLWAVITAVIVTQASVGGSIQVAFEQFLGSLLGAAYASIVALLVSPVDVITGTAALTLALAPLALLAALFPGFRIAPITGVIVLLGGAGLALGPIDLAISRMVEVGLGCSAGIVVSLLVLPAHASRAVLATAASTASHMAEQLDVFAMSEGKRAAELSHLAVKIRNNLLELATLVDEASRERRSFMASVPDAEPLLRTLRRLRHDLGTIRRTTPLKSDVMSERVDRSRVEAITASAETLRQAARVLVGASADVDLTTLSAAVREYASGLDEMRRSGLTQTLPTAALGRIFSSEFALNQLRRDLEEFAERCLEIATPTYGLKIPSPGSSGKPGR